MRTKNLLAEVIPLVLLVPLVMLIFRIVPDRKIAATLAGALFVSLPAWLMYRRFRHGNGLVAGHKASAVIWWGSVLQFWLLFALPILGARILFWETAFEDLQFFGQPAGDWHKLSSKSYMVMLVGVVISRVMERKSQKQKAGS